MSEHEPIPRSAGDQSEFPRVGFVAGTLGRGGAERQLYYMARALVDEGQPPVVASLTRGEHWEQPIKELGAPVVWFGRSANPLLRTLDLIRALRPHRPQLLQSAHFHTNLYTVAAARVLRVPDVGAIRNTTAWSVQSLGRFGALSLRLPRHLAINSLPSYQEADRRGIATERLSYLPNVVDPSLFSPAQHARAGVNVLSVARFVPQKRHDILVRLLRRLIDSFPELQISATLVGEGPLEGDLRRQLRDLRLDQRIRILSNADMAEVYGSASILVLTSEGEGTPNVLLEAMAAGLPVVAFGVGGVPGLVSTNDVGTCVPPMDEEGLFAAVARLVGDPELRVQQGGNGRQRILEHFSPDSLHDSLRLLYRRVAAQQSLSSRTASPWPGLPTAVYPK